MNDLPVSLACVVQGIMRDESLVSWFESLAEVRESERMAEFRRAAASISGNERTRDIAHATALLGVTGVFESILHHIVALRTP